MVGVGTPVTDALVRAKNSRRWTVEKEKLFFGALAESCNVRHSAEAAGMSERAAHYRRERNAAFAAQWVKALAAGYARLEMLMLDQAINGFEKVETVTGPDGEVKQVKKVRSYPHGVAMRLLQSHREAAERQRAMEAMGSDRDPGMVVKIRAEIARVRERLLGEEDVILPARRIDG